MLFQVWVPCNSKRLKSQRDWVQWVNRNSLSVIPDVNECLDSNICGEGRCVNTRGSYECECATGFAFPPGGNKCVDEDECALRLHHECDLNANCTNTIVSTLSSYSSFKGPLQTHPEVIFFTQILTHYHVFNKRIFVKNHRIIYKLNDLFFNWLSFSDDVHIIKGAYLKCDRKRFLHKNNSIYFAEFVITTTEETLVYIDS